MDAAPRKRFFQCLHGERIVSHGDIFENMHEDCERIETSSNVSFKTARTCNLHRVDKLLAATASSVLCLCVVLAGGQTEILVS